MGVRLGFKVSVRVYVCEGVGGHSFVGHPHDHSLDSLHQQTFASDHDHEDEGERRVDMHAHSHLSAQANVYRLGLLVLLGLRFRDLGGLIGISGVRFMVSVRIRCRVRVRVRVTYPRRLA